MVRGQRLASTSSSTQGSTSSYHGILDIGDYVWIGQRAWLDSVEMLTIENNVNISQGVYIICGGHDYKRVDHKTTYAPIHLEEGCWIGAFSMVTEGVTCWIPCRISRK